MDDFFHNNVTFLPRKVLIGSTLFLQLFSWQVLSKPFDNILSATSPILKQFLMRYGKLAVLPAAFYHLQTFFYTIIYFLKEFQLKLIHFENNIFAGSLTNPLNITVDGSQFQIRTPLSELNSGYLKMLRLNDMQYIQFKTGLCQNCQ